MPDSSLHVRHETAGARFVEEAGWRIPADFGDARAEHIACRESALLIDLSHRGKIRFEGPDAVPFLNGMLSNLVEGLGPGEGAYSTFLTRQGKIVADMTLYRDEAGLLADIAPGMAPVFAEAIDTFIIMDQVEVRDCTEEMFTLGVFGPASRPCLSKAGLEIPDLPENGNASCAGVLAARTLWTGEDGYLLMGHRDRAGELWEKVEAAGARPGGTAAFESLSMEAGIPLYGRELGPDVNPMQAGLEERAVDFEKGCYIGQEVIAKIKYLGQVNRGLVGIRVAGNAVPPEGASVMFGEMEAGVITRAIFSPTLEGVIAFAYLHRDAMVPGTQVRIQPNDSFFEGEVAGLPFYKAPETIRTR
ncbi:MAG: aminomethyltransferase family protein [Nitrospinota bacterium]|nr:aminomethyltransferase family protein [Nitrospinota bacterium]